MKYLVYRKCPVCKYEHEFLLEDFYGFKDERMITGIEEDAKNYIATKDLKITKGTAGFRLETNKTYSITFGGPIRLPSFKNMVCPECGVWMDNRATVTKIK